jgi:hypothetical protein
VKHSHCLSPSRAHKIDAPINGASYSRLFTDLPAFSAEEAFLYALGRSGGLCDCGDLDDEPASLGTEAAGWPFFGQFTAHDITADRSSLRSHVNPSQLRNAHTPQLNLESLYGGGPAGNPYLFERSDPAKLLTGPDGHDVLRNYEGTAVIGDPRNDSHVFMSQMHLAFVRAHNAFVDLVRSEGTPESELFETAAQELRWHYQTVILREFLPLLVGPDMVASLLDEGPRFYRPSGQPFIPLEFADAAYRYGHSQIRQKYVLNDRSEPVRIFPDLLGFQPVTPNHTIDWARMFDSPGQPAAARAKKIDGRLVGALISLPLAVSGEAEVQEYHSLAVRDLQRGQGVGLPSGEVVARFLHEEPLSREEVGADKAGWPGETPLWYYILREADVRNNGNRLGPVGARIVGDVLVGLLDLDSSSVRHAPAGWEPRASLIELLTTGQHIAGDDATPTLAKV